MGQDVGERAKESQIDLARAHRLDHSGVVEDRDDLEFFYLQFALEVVGERLVLLQHLLGIFGRDERNFQRGCRASARLDRQRALLSGSAPSHRRHGREGGGSRGGFDNSGATGQRVGKENDLHPITPIRKVMHGRCVRAAHAELRYQPDGWASADLEGSPYVMRERSQALAQSITVTAAMSIRT